MFSPVVSMSRCRIIFVELLLLSGALVPRAAESASFARADSDVTVLRSDAQSILIEYRPRFRPDVTVQGRSGDFVVMDFAGATTQGRGRAPGEPDLRLRVIPLAFPSVRGNTIRVVTAEYADVRGAVLAPVPLRKMKDGLPESTTYEPDPERYATGKFLPADPADIGPIGPARSVFVGTVRFSPVQFNPSTRTIRRYTRIVVQITYGSPDGTLRTRPGQAMVTSSLANARAASAWRGGAVLAAAGTPSVLSSGDWYRLSVTTDGMYYLDAAYLSSLGINVASLDPRTIRIFGNGGAEVPEDLSASRAADLTENAIYVSGEDDGKFDAGDFVVFYGRGTRNWKYDALSKTWRHSINHYTETNYYWLTVNGTNGKRMSAKISLPSSSTVTTVQTCLAPIAVEEEKINILASGKDWYGQSITPGSSFTHVIPLAGLLPGATIRYRYGLVSESTVPSSFTVREGGTAIGSHYVSGASDYNVATEGVFQTSGTSSLPSPSSQLSIQYSSSSIAAIGFVDWIEVVYPRTLWGVNDTLCFRAPDTTAVVEYSLGQFSTTPMIFDVTSFADVKRVDGVAGAYLFRAAESAGSPSVYWAVAGNAWRHPVAATKIANQNLHGETDGADFIIVTSSEFRSAADRLKTYREDPAHGGLRTSVADVAAIYNEFGGGLPDVTAIRDFLQYAYNTWTIPPQFVLMLGEGSYDYKGLLGSTTSKVPTWQSLESENVVDSYATDDFFAEFGAGAALSLVMGRVSARTSAEAEAFVDKLARYEQGSAQDNWKMRVLYVADDAWTSELGDTPGDGTIHGDDAEAVAQPSCTPDEFEKKKIYIAEYPTVNAAQGRRKPGAYQAIIDQINQGSLIVNYSGHGNPTLWAHEDIFDVTTSIPQLKNADRLSFFFLATCNFSQFDDPKRETGSEILMNKPDGGAIAVIAATREVYENYNASLNLGTYQGFLNRDSLGRVVVDRPAVGLFRYKLQGNGENDQKFFFMGDPTMTLQFPAGYASIDSINGENVDSVAGAPRTSAIQLRSLSHVTLSGTVRNGANMPDAAFNGVTTLTINDATRTQTIVNYYPGHNWSYTATGGTIYRGENSVVNGRFRATFIVPKDIQYADSTALGRLTAYIYRTDDKTADHQAYTGRIRVGGTDTTAVNDGKGPSIAIYLGNRNFRSGDVVSTQPPLYVDLHDSSGINTSVSGIGHRIEAWVDNATESQDLTAYFVSKLDDYRQGTVQFQLAALPAGQNSIRIRAWDSFDNSATAEVSFVVASTDRLTVTDMFNYPNPFGGEGTSFTFRQNQSVPLRVTVKVFTVAGRLIRTIDTETGGDSFVKVPWDGRDRDGDVIANGVYLYKLTVKTVDGQFTSDLLGKMAKIQ